MCGIAGYSLSPASEIDRTRAAQALLAAIAERGADAVGYAYRSAADRITVHKQRSGPSGGRGFEEFRGSMAAAWLDERHPDLLYLARGVGRPLWVGTTRRELFFASTEQALEIAERYTGVRLRKREVAEGTLVAIAGARAS